MRAQLVKTSQFATTLWKSKNLKKALAKFRITKPNSLSQFKKPQNHSKSQSCTNLLSKSYSHNHWIQIYCLKWLLKVPKKNSKSRKFRVRGNRKPNGERKLFVSSKKSRKGWWRSRWGNSRRKIGLLLWFKVTKLAEFSINTHWWRNYVSNTQIWSLLLSDFKWSWNSWTHSKTTHRLNKPKLFWYNLSRTLTRNDCNLMTNFTAPFQMEHRG